MSDGEALDGVTIVREAFDRLNAHDVAGCVAMLHPDFAINIAGMPYAKHGTRAWEENVGTMLRAFPDVAVTVDDAFAADDRVTVRVTIEGTHLGEFVGMAPTGRRVSYTSIEVYRIVDGLIAEEWICSDTATLFTQVGMFERGRLVATWLARYRTWFGFAGGAGAALLVRPAVQRLRSRAG